MESRNDVVALPVERAQETENGYSTSRRVDLAVTRSVGRVKLYIPTTWPSWKIVLASAGYLCRHIQRIAAVCGWC